MISSRRRFLALVPGGIAALSLGEGKARADEPVTEPDQMPHIDCGKTLAVRAGEMVKIYASFDAGNENCIQVFDQGTGQKLQQWINYSGGGGEWSSAGTPRPTRSSCWSPHCTKTRHPTGTSIGVAPGAGSWITVHRLLAP